MHMVSDSSDTEQLYFVSLCDPAHERPKSFLDFTNQQRFAIFNAKNTVNVERSERIGHR
jgi:hypothetical protein